MNPVTNFTARELSSHSGSILDASQRGPVLITKQGRPFSVLVSYEGLEAQLSSLSELDSSEKLKQAVLFGAHSNAMEENAMSDREMEEVLALVEQPCSTDDMVQQIISKNGWAS